MHKPNSAGPPVEVDNIVYYRINTYYDSFFLQPIVCGI